MKVLLAFFGFSPMRSHFWPFTEVMRKIRREVTRKVILVSFGYGQPNAIGYAEHRSRSHDAVIRVYDSAGNVIETHESAGDFKKW